MTFLDRSFSGASQVLDARVREKLPGKTAWLTDGVTYYEEDGPKDGKPVVLIHGFSVPSFIWDPTFDALAKAGFRMLRYDLFGRGYSDRSNLRYDKALFVRQLAELMEAVHFSQADLVSVSMGGVVAAEFAYRFPKRVNKLVFIDPAGFGLDLPFSIKLLYLPGFGEIILGILGRFGSGTLLEAMLADFFRPTPEAVAAFSSRYLEQMKYRGFKTAILSSLRSGLLDEDLELFRRVASLEKPVLLIWGKEDQTVPFGNSQTFLKLVPQAEFQSIQDAGHIPHFERPELVNPILLRFLEN